MSAPSLRARRPFTLRGVHVLAAMLLFFAAIIAINVLFAVVAFRTFPGEDVRRSYLQGLRYNETLEARRAQALLGWRASAVIAPDGKSLIVRVVSAEGAGVAGLQLSGVLRRPADARWDKTLVFESLGDGAYRARLRNLAPGAWTLRATAARDGANFELTQRFTWSP